MIQVTDDNDPRDFVSGDSQVVLVDCGRETARIPDGSSSLSFDIETEPLPSADLERIIAPFDRSSIKHPGEFDPTTVKTGNLKDESKIAAKIEAARTEHLSRVQSHESDVEIAESEYWQKAIEASTLNASRSRVCAIGVRFSGDAPMTAILHGEEADMLASLWSLYVNANHVGMRIYGFNTMDFDLPYVVRRSWVNDVPVPPSVRNGRYWSDTFVDLAREWSMGGRDHISLDELSRTFGMAGKRDQECKGKLFWTMWSDPSRRSLAIEYLATDVMLVEQVALRMGKAV